MPDSNYTCVVKEKQSKKGSKYTGSGTVILNSILVEIPPTFLDFIRAGTQVGRVNAYDLKLYFL